MAGKPGKPGNGLAVGARAKLREGLLALSGVVARRIVFWALVATLVAVRVLVAVESTGTNDILFWNTFAGQIAAHGISWVYSNVHIFNHPPLMGYWARAALALSKGTSIGFPIVFKIPFVLADIGSGLVLWRVWTLRSGPTQGNLALAAYTFGLTSILISAYHGNTDGLCAFLCLLAVYFAERGRHFSMGLALGAALNVKVIPMLLLPALVLRRRSWAQASRAAGGLAIWALPFMSFIGIAPHFFHNIFAYVPGPENYGLPFVFGQLSTLNHVGPAIAKVAAWYTEHSRTILIGSILLVVIWGWLCRVDLYRISSAVFGLFLFLTPGFGTQYMIYLAPPLFAVSLWQGFCYSTIAGIFLALDYIHFWNGKLPAETIFTGPSPLPAALVGLVAWAMAGQVVVKVVRESDWRRAFSRLSSRVAVLAGLESNQT